jgi:glycolate oxidase
MPDPLLSSLAQIYPTDRVLTQPAALAPYECDALTATRVRPRAVVLPETQEEVIETVRLCYRLGLPFVARGSGTSLSGGSQPLADGIVIALNRLDRIVTIDPAARIAVVEPGVINVEVSKAAAPYNLYYAPDPASQLVCTIGGNVAFNAGGVHCLKYGMTSNHVLGIKAVLGDGQVVHLGGESLEGVGPDLPGLFVGNEGTFGIALELTLRLIARVERYKTVLAAYRSLQEAGDAVSMIVARGLLPGALEIMDPLAIKATEAAAHPGYPLDAGALLIVELEGEALEVEADFAVLLEVLSQSGAYQVRPAASDAERMLIWKGRKSAFSAVGRLTPQYIVQDGVVPRSNLGAALARISELSQQYGIPVANVFHAGDGNLHPLIFYNAKTPGELHKAEEMASQILHLCIELGGSITGEHGVGLEKRAYLPQMFGEADMTTMTRLRQAMDPKEIANRGKMLEVAGGRWQGANDTLQVAGGELHVASDAGTSHVSRSTEPVVQPQSIGEVQEAVRTSERVLVRGGGTKPGMSAPVDGATVLDMRGLSGIAEYEPDEFVFTALAGTPLAEIAALLAEHGQYLPFDPPFVDAGATLGGATAAGLSGPRRYRYGGLRDFVIGVRFVDGRGDVVRGGGKVVKNAAGFDLPKLLAGSLGRLGALVELSFKVFPQPPAFATLRLDHASLAAAIDAMTGLTSKPLDIEALDLEPAAGGASLLVRIGGREDLLRPRVERLQGMVGGGELLAGMVERTYWHGIGELQWAAGSEALVKTPLNARQVVPLDQQLAEIGLTRRYSVAGNAAWIALPQAAQLPALDSALTALNLAGVVVRGPAGRPLLGVRSGDPFYRRVKQALDPDGRFGEL